MRRPLAGAARVLQQTSSELYQRVGAGEEIAVACRDDALATALDRKPHVLVKAAEIDENHLLHRAPRRATIAAACSSPIRRPLKVTYSNRATTSVTPYARKHSLQGGPLYPTPGRRRTWPSRMSRALASQRIDAVHSVRVGNVSKNARRP